MFGIVRVYRSLSKYISVVWMRVEQGTDALVGVVRLYRTSSKYILKGACARQFRCIKTPRTILNYIIAEIARCAKFLNMCSKWFNITEPSLDTPLKVKQGVQHDYTLVLGSASASNLLDHFIVEITSLVDFFDTCLG